MMIVIVGVICMMVVMVAGVRMHVVLAICRRRTHGAQQAPLEPAQRRWRHGIGGAAQ
eukprot:CAMPEP_0184974512 /NCGR_PEP_ID=MMETSP1098-20130426/6015_1 /TAXON_ID=89044 /ORGANISM="Spumella elongata, Strain CCAP 955/1" /LENGTH=56 /DNA_ID=CAMNT_0027497123 /DNA_START=23 /DNA_END=190 /DNA_ORIENTATION=-